MFGVVPLGLRVQRTQRSGALVSSEGFVHGPNDARVVNHGTLPNGHDTSAMQSHLAPRLSIVAYLFAFQDVTQITIRA